MFLYFASPAIECIMWVIGVLWFHLKVYRREIKDTKKSLTTFNLLGVKLMCETKKIHINSLQIYMELLCGGKLWMRNTNTQKWSKGDGSRTPKQKKKIILKTILCFTRAWFACIIYVFINFIYFAFWLAIHNSAVCRVYFFLIFTVPPSPFALSLFLLSTPKKCKLNMKFISERTFCLFVILLSFVPRYIYICLRFEALEEVVYSSKWAIKTSKTFSLFLFPSELIT